MRRRTVDALIIGGGPSGLACAIELARLGVRSPLVVEREAQAGGIPRHTHHTGFGLRDLHRLLTGPRYAERYRALAEASEVDVQTETTVMEWAGPTAVRLTSPGGLETVHARAIVLATGCRERPRSARLVPGSRPQGVLTTGLLQQLVYLYELPVGRRAVIVGAEHVSFSVVHTLAHAGVKPVAMVTEHAAHQSYWPLKLVTADRHRVPIHTRTAVSSVRGRGRVNGVEVTDLDSGRQRSIDCDTVVFTANWIPDHELARLGGLAIDPGTRGPAIDLAQRTSRRGVFACGNLLHAAETADRAAQCGRFAARSVAAYLEDGEWPAAAPIPIRVEEPLAWVSPNALPCAALSRSQPADQRIPHGHLLLRVDRILRSCRVEVWQGDRQLWETRLRRLVPGISVHLPAPWITRLDPDVGHVRLKLATAADD